jgi:hypothetical protein
MYCRALRLAAILVGGLVGCLAGLLAAPAHGWEKQWNEAPAIEDSCLAYDARYSEAPLFQIVARNANNGAPGKVNLFSRKIACAQGVSLCPARTNAYLIDRDVVFGGPQDNNFRCVYYGTVKGKIVAGFVPTENLAPFAENEELTQDFLRGVWTYDGNPQIVITPADNNKVSATGDAAWPGLGAQALHTGSFSAVASPAGKEITFRDGDGEYSCKVDLLRRGPYLVAKDNGYCGGMNVRFSGILMKVLGGR